MNANELTLGIREAVEAVVSTYWEQELQDAQEQWSNHPDIADHIFTHLVTLSNAVNGTNATAESYMEEE